MLNGEVISHRAVTTRSAYKMLGVGASVCISLTCPFELVACDGVIDLVESIVDSQNQGHRTVAAFGALQRLDVAAAFGVGVSCPSVGTTSGFLICDVGVIVVDGYGLWDDCAAASVVVDDSSIESSCGRNGGVRFNDVVSVGIAVPGDGAALREKVDFLLTADTGVAHNRCIRQRVDDHVDSRQCTFAAIGADSLGKESGAGTDVLDLVGVTSSQGVHFTVVPIDGVAR